MSNADPLLRLIRVLEDELRTPPTQRTSGATDDGLRSAIMDAQQAVLEVQHDVADDIQTAMSCAPESSRRLWSQVTFDGRRTVDLSDRRSPASFTDRRSRNGVSEAGRADFDPRDERRRA